MFESLVDVTLVAMLCRLNLVFEANEQASDSETLRVGPSAGIDISPAQTIS